MRSMALAVVFVLGCGSSPVDEAEGLAKEMCACKDQGCIDKVMDKLEKLGEKFKDKKPSEADMKRLNEVGRQVSRCRQPGGSIGAFNRYTSKSKTSEARQFIKKIADGARAYYMDAGYSRGSLTPIPPQFPGPSIGPTPPLGKCCEDGNDKCTPDATLWNAPQWVALHFSVDDPHYYSYSYEVSPDGKSITARANGDLDCDGKYSTFELYVNIPDGDDMPQMTGAIYRENELE